MALINYNGEGGRIYFYPFCSNNFEDIAKECVGCQFAQEAGLAHVRNGSVQYPIFGQLCNPHVQVYPLPLYKCSVCSQSLLNAVLTYIIVVSLLTFSGNSWSILVWLREKKRPQIFFKLSLAISDFLFGTILLPSIAASLITTMYLPHEEYFAFSTYLDQGVDEYEYNWMALFSPFHNRFTALILYISQGASLSSVLLLNIDRHIAITYNIKYYQIMSKRKSLCIVISMWLVVASLALATTFTCGTFLTKPFALFLPVVEPESNKKELLKVLVIYLLPLSIIFFASCIIALCTSVKLYNLSKSNIVYRSAGFATTKAGIQRIRKFPFFQWYQKPYQIKKDNHSELQNETTQVACDCNTNCNLNFEQVDAKSESFLKNRNEDITRETCVPQEFELGPLAPNLLEEKKQQNGFDRKISQELSQNRGNEYRSATRTLMLILASYALCVLPLTILLITYLIDEKARHEEEHHEEPFNKAILDGFAVSVGIFMLSSLRNCIIYSLRNREYRSSSKSLWKNIKNKICRNAV